MARSPRFQRFLFEPSRLKNDPAFQAMTPEGRGLYATLFCSAWEQPEPGVLLANPATLAPLAFATTEEWERNAASVARAFDTSSRPGFWIQRGLVATHRAQKRIRKTKSDGGKLGAKRKREKQQARTPDGTRNPSAIFDLNGVGSGVGSGVGVGVGSGESKAEPKTRAAPVPFVRPTLPEVEAYCIVRGKGVDPQVWLDHYQSNGWRVGQNAMKDWRAAVRTWEGNRYPSRNGTARSNGKVNAADIRAFRLKLEAEEAQR